MAVPAVLRRAASSGPFGAVVDGLERLLPGRPDSLAVLTFHRVSPDAGTVPPGLLSATPETFGGLLDALARRHRFVRLEDVLARSRGGTSLPRRSLLLTFDDAYADFAQHAWPVIRERRLPVVLFVPTAYPDSHDRMFWWDRLYASILATRIPAIDLPGRSLPVTTPAERQAAYRTLRASLKAMDHERLLQGVDGLVSKLCGDATEPQAAGNGVLGWDELRRLAAEGVALAPHTRTHPLLPGVPPNVVQAEIRGSRDDLARETDSDLPVFAYPAGAWSPEVAESARAAGIEVAFTTDRGVNSLDRANWLALRRINVSARVPAAVVRAQVLR
jgi:peptidoglycan/xylan/chitin deacetylase (PgdA/CDA1 family)